MAAACCVWCLAEGTELANHPDQVRHGGHMPAKRATRKTPQKTAEKRAEQSPTRKLLGLIRELALIFGAVVVINSFVLASFEVPTGSMEDTVMIGDRLFVNRFIYGGSTPYTIPLTSIRIPHVRVPGFRRVARGDVIVFDWPGPRDLVGKPRQMWYLKRCIGLPGDKIEIQNRVLYVNDRVVPDPPLGKHIRPASWRRDQPNPNIFPRGSKYNEDNYGPLTVPRKGMKIALNDADVESWEVFIRREGHEIRSQGGGISVDGAAAREYVVERDYIFAMGDNRDNSLDSRFWGFVPLEDVIGTPMIVYWSWNPDIPIFHLIDKLGSANLRRIGTIVR
jgi:signal peptidase I